MRLLFVLKQWSADLSVVFSLWPVAQNVLFVAICWRNCWTIVWAWTFFFFFLVSLKQTQTQSLTLIKHSVCNRFWLPLYLDNVLLKVKLSHHWLVPDSDCVIHLIFKVVVSRFYVRKQMKALSFKYKIRTQLIPNESGFYVIIFFYWRVCHCFCLLSQFSCVCCSWSHFNDACASWVFLSSEHERSVPTGGVAARRFLYVCRAVHLVVSLFPFPRWFSKFFVSHLYDRYVLANSHKYSTGVETKKISS